MKTILAIIFVYFFLNTKAQDTITVSMTDKKEMRIFVNDNHDTLFVEIIQDKEVTCRTFLKQKDIEKFVVTSKGHAYVIVKTLNKNSGKNIKKKWKIFHCAIRPEPKRIEPRISEKE